MSPITPELALIDPELAAAARALLPEPGAFRPDWSTRTGRAIPTLPVQLLPNITAEAPSPRRRRRRGTLSVVGALAIGVAAIAIAVTQSGSGDGAKEAEPGRATSSLSAARDRTFAWPDVPGAESYRITLLRGEQLVFEATSRTPTLVLPPSLTFRPGRYTLAATPQLAGSRTSTRRPVIEETFVVAPL